MTYMILIALKDLNPGDEIGVDYGKDYIESSSSSSSSGGKRHVNKKKVKSVK